MPATLFPLLSLDFCAHCMFVWLGKDLNWFRGSTNNGECQPLLPLLFIYFWRLCLFSCATLMILLLLFPWYTKVLYCGDFEGPLLQLFEQVMQLRRSLHLDIPSIHGSPYSGVRHWCIFEQVAWLMITFILKSWPRYSYYVTSINI